MTPVVDGIEQTFGEQLVIKRINAAEGDGPEIMRTYHIPGHPTMLIFDQTGQEVQRLIGPQQAAAVEVLVADLLAE